MSVSFCFGGIYRDKVPLCTVSLENGEWERYYFNMFEHNQISLGFNCIISNGYILGTYKEQDQPIYFLVGTKVDQASMEESLSELKRIFVRKNSNWRFAEQNSLMSVFGQEFKQFLINRSRIAKVGTIKKNASETIDIMNDNLLKVTERGERLSELEEISTQMGQNVIVYNRESKKVKRKLCCDKYRTYILGASLGLFVLYIILVLACGGFDLKPRCIHPAPLPTPTPIPTVEPEFDPF